MEPKPQDTWVPRERAVRTGYEAWASQGLPVRRCVVPTQKGTAHGVASLPQIAL